MKLSAVVLLTATIASAPLVVAQSSPHTETLVLHKSDDGNRYFLTFSARGGTDQGTSPLGHAFVVWGKEDSSTHTSSYVAYGLYPKEKNWKNEIHSAFGKVPGELVNEDTMHSVLPTTDSLIVEVNRSDYDHTLSVANGIAAGGERRTKFQLLQEDCVTFVSQVAFSLGVNMPPPRSVLSGNAGPQSYIRSLITSATTPVTIQGRDATYTGQTYKGYPNGKGSYKSDSGDSFDGDFEMGHFKNGTMKYSTGVTYSGEFANGRPSNGTMTYASGNAYTGPFDGDMIRSGEASFKWKDGASFEGKFDNDGLSTGKITAPNYTYRGDFRNSLPEGQGKFEYPNGDSLDATYQNGVITQGTYRWQDGRTQSGNMKSGLFEGQTERKSPDGSRYVGGWADGHAEGQGTLFRADGSHVSGNWKGGKLEGGAKITDSQGHERGFSPQDAKDSDTKSANESTRGPDTNVGPIDRGDAPPIRTPPALN